MNIKRENWTKMLMKEKKEGGEHSFTDQFLIEKWWPLRLGNALGTYAFWLQKFDQFCIRRMKKKCFMILNIYLYNICYTLSIDYCNAAGEKQMIFKNDI